MPPPPRALSRALADRVRVLDRDGGHETMSLFPPHGPSLPPFQSLLVKGKYHSSAPIHLCLSRALQPDTKKILLLVLSRRALTATLKELKDEWVQSHGGEGEAAGAALKVDVLYPPTPRHLMVLLSMFHEALQGEDDIFQSKTTFAETPSLVVLCDLSSYFVGDPSTIVSSYLVMISRALASVSSMSERSGACTSLAVFDSGLDSLRLPLFRPVSPAQVHEGDTSTSTSSERRESLAFLIQRYFEWVGKVTVQEDSSADVQDDPLNGDVKRVCSLHLQRPETESADVVLKWTERVAPNSCTSFTFPSSSGV